MSEKKLVKSVSNDQSEIIHDILTLYTSDGKIDCDPTYSKGNFYKNTGIERPKYCFDIAPQDELTVASDCRNLPLADASIQTLMFDPPFLATTGKSLISSENNNIINKRFSVFPSEIELHQFYVDSLKEFYRVLKPHGILIFKCQDKMSGGKQYMSHVFVCNQAIENHFYPKDLFILTAKNRIVANWQLENQKSARKFHSYFWVFEKDGKEIRYINYPV